MSNSTESSLQSFRELAEALGLDPSLARLIPVEATVETLEEDAESALWDKEAVKSLFTEARSASAPVTDEGRPRVLRISAWIAHAGPANRNGDAFLEDDLQDVVAKGLFAPPYVGILDFNHDFMPYGVWFSARYEFDPVAQQYGLLAEGVLLAWRFPELADKILAEQVRHGHVRVSMACIPQSIEYRESLEGRSESVLRKPVFMAVSVLDVPQGDLHARGLGSESEGSTSDERVRELNKALLNIHAAGDGYALWFAIAEHQNADGNIDSQEDTQMDEKIIAQLTEALGEKAAELIGDLKSAVADAAKVPALETEVADLTTANEGLQVELEAAQTEVDNLKAAVEAKNTALEAIKAELEAAQQALEELQTAHDGLVAEAEAKRKEELRKARMEQLPEHYRAALEARDEEAREKIIARFVEMSDEDFAEELAVLAAPSPRRGYLDRSEGEGVLTPSAGSGSGGYAVDKFLN